MFNKSHPPAFQKRLLPVLWLFVVFLFSNTSVAATSIPSKKNDAYIAPELLFSGNVSTKQQAAELLGSVEFNEQMVKFAQRLQKTIDLDGPPPIEQAIALASLLQNYPAVVSQIKQTNRPHDYFQYQANAEYHLIVDNHKLQKNNENDPLLIDYLKSSFNTLSDESLYLVSYTLSWSLSRGQDYMLYLFQEYQNQRHLTQAQSLDLIRNYQLYRVYEKLLPLTEPLLTAELDKRYIVEPDVIIKTPNGISLSALVVRKRGDTQKRPTAFQFTIYADKAFETRIAMHAVAHGYVGVIANTRGKGNTTDAIVPYEHDGKDANSVIDWIIAQPWSDQQVVMHGGSYLGFTQWATAKYQHPALKTIVPSEAANPIVGLPIENNIFITANYPWAFHVTNNKTMDHSAYGDYQHIDNAMTELYQSGRAFRDIDKIEGSPNPWFQKWLNHPEFDEYYQAMLPYGKDYAKINIPVLSITGYFGSVISATDYLKRHYQSNPNANHTLLIGPYDHQGAIYSPRSHYSNYQLDPVALQKDTPEITFQWFDHVLFNKPLPDLIKDKVNYQLMGSNTWQHSNSYQALNEQNLAFYLSTQKNQQGYYALSLNKPKQIKHLQQSVDLSDRTTQFNVETSPVIQDSLQADHGLVFITEPMRQPQQLVGELTGKLEMSINKRDVDFGFNFYEMTDDGKLFHLTYYRSRASYANDMSKRQLLIAETKTSIPIVNSLMMGKLIKKGSRLVLVLDVNKNAGSQVNMGTGKDVSDETAADGKQPLLIKWFNDSQINIPLKSWTEKNCKST